MTNIARQNTTGTLAVLAYAVVALLTVIGLDLPFAVATGFVVLVIAVTSMLKPRWEEGRSLLSEHPAGVAGAATTVLAWLAPPVGLDIDADGAAAIIAGITALVSLFTPRSETANPTDDLNRPGVGQ